MHSGQQIRILDFRKPPTIWDRLVREFKFEEGENSHDRIESVCPPGHKNNLSHLQWLQLLHCHWEQPTETLRVVCWGGLQMAQKYRFLAVCKNCQSGETHRQQTQNPNQNVHAWCAGDHQKQHAEQTADVHPTAKRKQKPKLFDLGLGAELQWAIGILLSQFCCQATQN